MQRPFARLQRLAQTAHGWSKPLEPSCDFSFWLKGIARVAAVAARSFVYAWMEN
jgi:hypothetical protein